MKWLTKLRIDRGNAILEDYGLYYNVVLSRYFWRIQKSGEDNCSVEVLGHMDISDSFYVYLSYIDRKWKLEVVREQEEGWDSQVFEL